MENKTKSWIVVISLLVYLPSIILSSKRCYYPDGQIKGYCHDEIFSSPGQVRFSVMVGVHSPRDAHSCGDISPGGVQTAMAVKWIVDILNGAGDFSKAFVPGIRLGLFGSCDIYIYLYILQKIYITIYMYVIY